MIAEKIATTYRKAQMGLVGALAGTTAIVLDETSFYDVGYMQTQINRIKKELSRVSNDLKVQYDIKDNTDSWKRRTGELIQEREQLLLQMIFLASNSFANLDSCVSMAEGHNYDFMRCVNGLLAYQRGNKQEAYQVLEAFIREHGTIDGHFLINKVYGLLLMERNMHQKAISYLSCALQHIPTDTECLNGLKECYQVCGNTKRASVVSDVLALLA